MRFGFEGKLTLSLEAIEQFVGLLFAIMAILRKGVVLLYEFGFGRKASLLALELEQLAVAVDGNSLLSL